MSAPRVIVLHTVVFVEHEISTRSGEMTCACIVFEMDVAQVGISRRLLIPLENGGSHAESGRLHVEYDPVVADDGTSDVDRLVSGNIARSRSCVPHGHPPC